MTECSGMFRALTCSVERLCAENAPLECVFNGPVSLPIGQYIERLGKYLKLEPAVLVCGVINMDKLRIPVHADNVHRLLLTSLVVTKKFWTDSPPNNEFFALVGGISLREMNVLERRFLQRLNYDFSLPLFEQYRWQLETHRCVSCTSRPDEN